MHQPPLLSIVVPTYNMEKYLARCLDSLLKQDIGHDQLEIIIVNDGSKDSSLTIAQNYASKNTHIIIVDQENSGVGAARNAGLQQACGTYVYFVDPDDFIAPNVLGTLSHLLNTYNVDILAFDFVDLPEGKMSVTDKEVKVPENVTVQSGLEFIGSKNYTNECWWFITKKAFLSGHKISFMEDRLMEDVIYTLEVILNAKNMSYVPIDVYRYMTIPNSVRTSKEPKHYRRFIFDCEYAVFKMALLIDDIDKKNTPKSAIKRLKTKQQSIVFFLLLRLAKSDISFRYVTKMLHRFKKVQAFPLTYFPGDDFKGILYKTLAFCVNNSVFRIPFLLLLRFFERLKYQLNKWKY